MADELINKLKSGEFHTIFKTNTVNLKRITNNDNLEDKKTLNSKENKQEDEMIIKNNNKCGSDTKKFSNKPIFKDKSFYIDVYICKSDFSDNYRKLILENGGQVRSRLTNSVDFVIFNEGKDDTIGKAVLYQLPLLNPVFIEECIKKGEIIDIEEFIVNKSYTDIILFKENEKKKRKSDDVEIAKKNHLISNYFKKKDSSVSKININSSNKPKTSISKNLKKTKNTDNDTIKEKNKDNSSNTSDIIKAFKSKTNIKGFMNKKLKTEIKDSFTETSKESFTQTNDKINTNKSPIKTNLKATDNHDSLSAIDNKSIDSKAAFKSKKMNKKNKSKNNSRRSRSIKSKDNSKSKELNSSNNNDSKGTNTNSTLKKYGKVKHYNENNPNNDIEEDISDFKIHCKNNNSNESIGIIDKRNSISNLKTIYQNHKPLKKLKNNMKNNTKLLDESYLKNLYDTYLPGRSLDNKSNMINSIDVGDYRDNSNCNLSKENKTEFNFLNELEQTSKALIKDNISKRSLYSNAKTYYNSNTSYNQDNNHSKYSNNNNKLDSVYKITVDSNIITSSDVKRGRINPTSKTHFINFSKFRHTKHKSIDSSKKTFNMDNEINGKSPLNVFNSNTSNKKSINTNNNKTRYHSFNDDDFKYL